MSPVPEYSITDEVHAEYSRGYSSFEAALEELRGRSAIPWDQPPNRCPCTSWRTCQRHYSVVKYTGSDESYVELDRTPIVVISASGVEWLLDDLRREHGA